ncbi:UNVERIFIED_CONTAM: hypothetical protein HDU68_001871 [Siphonaria sp. JEL0065]|nr:hypothetical protein HDU68_001871 [Siphonaria sp. JEL0065]
MTTNEQDSMMSETPSVIVQDFSCIGIKAEDHSRRLLAEDSACDLTTPTSDSPSSLPLLPLSTFTHASTLSAGIACTKSSRPTPPSSATNLPNELLVLVCLTTPTASLLAMRLTCKRMRALADIVLRDRMRATVGELESGVKRLSEELELLEVEKRPHLRHYKQFLRNISMNDITEAIWYASPPEELKTVCECLCILKGLPSPVAAASSSSNTNKGPSFLESSSNTNRDNISTSLNSLNITSPTDTQDVSPTSTSLTQDPQTWASVKKQMTRYDFKNWVSNLRTNVDKIPYAAVKRVEYIIMHDQNITYERLREVSRPGYSLLIVVAACLQYGNISEDVKVKVREVGGVEEKLRVGRLFLACVE